MTHGDEDDRGYLGFEEAPAQFESATQIARVMTERWALGWLFCPNCGERSLGQFANNSKVADFHCQACREEYELKSTKGRFGPKIVDGAYRAMRERLAARNNPNFVLLNYDAAARSATDLAVVPKHFFTPDVIEQRKPLAATARRAGWVGCNILLDRIPTAGRIYLLRDRTPVPKAEVRAQWDKTLFLRQTALDARGWLLDVMQVVDGLNRESFALEDIYRGEEQLQALHPNNRNVRPKIRQQLQVLRDHGYLRFLGNGRYERTDAENLATSHRQPPCHIAVLRHPAHALADGGNHGGSDTG